MTEGGNNLILDNVYDLNTEYAAAASLRSGHSSPTKKMPARARQ